MATTTKKAAREGMPERFEGPSAWVGSDLAVRPDAWRHALTENEIGELIRAAERYLSTGSDIAGIAPREFPLPEFGAEIGAMRRELLTGVGFRVLTGLPMNDLGIERSAAIFLGIGAHIGRARSQNAAGHLLGHVRDMGADPGDPNARIYQTHARQTFHTDSADVVGLLCLNEAREGGDSLLVSVETIANRMREKRPDLFALLFDPISTDRRGEVPDGENPWMDIPPLNWHGGKLTVFYQRQYIDSAQRFEDAFPLTPRHVEALDMFDGLANAPELHLTMRLAPGDMQFVHNHGQLHDRTEFTDWPEPERRRHLLRLWLTVDGDRPLPEVFRQRYGSIEIGNRGGIITRETCPRVALKPY